MNKDFAEMLSALFEEGAEFLIVGAYALATHGYVRATGDIDIWIKPSPDNALRVFRALQKYGAPLSDLSTADLSEPDLVFQIGVPPWRIDLLTSISGVTFDEAWARRDSFDIDGHRVAVIGMEHLLLNKRSTGRTRDLADAEELARLKKN